MPQERICPVCSKTYLADKPSSKQKTCSHSCAFSRIGGKVRAAAKTPEARKKQAASRRASANQQNYVKRDGRHEHRIVVEARIGRLLRSDEIVHHRNEVKRDNSDQNLELTDRAEHARIHFSKVLRSLATHCGKGHEFTSENIYYGSNGGRRCLACRRIYDAKWKRDKRVKSKQLAGV